MTILICWIFVSWHFWRSSPNELCDRRGLQLEFLFRRLPSRSSPAAASSAREPELHLSKPGLQKFVLRNSTFFTSVLGLEPLQDAAGAFHKEPCNGEFSKTNEIVLLKSHTDRKVVVGRLVGIIGPQEALTDADLIFAAWAVGAWFCFGLKRKGARSTIDSDIFVERVKEKCFQMGTDHLTTILVGMEDRGIDIPLSWTEQKKLIIAAGSNPSCADVASYVIWRAEKKDIPATTVGRLRVTSGSQCVGGYLTEYALQVKPAMTLREVWHVFDTAFGKQQNIVVPLIFAERKIGLLLASVELSEAVSFFCEKYATLFTARSGKRELEEEDCVSLNALQLLLRKLLVDGKLRATNANPVGVRPTEERKRYEHGNFEKTHAHASVSKLITSGVSSSNVKKRRLILRLAGKSNTCSTNDATFRGTVLAILSAKGLLKLLGKMRNVNTGCASTRVGFVWYASSDSSTTAQQAREFLRTLELEPEAYFSALK